MCSTYATALALLYRVLFRVGYRAENFIIGLTNTSPAVTKPTMYRGTMCGQYPGKPPRGGTVSVYCNANIQTMFRYVYVQLPAKKLWLNFCELEVFVKGMSMMLTARGTGYKCIQSLVYYIVISWPVMSLGLFCPWQLGRQFLDTKKINRRYTGIETLAKGKRVSLESLMPIIPIFTVT